MGRIQEMIFPFMIILFAINAMFLFMVYLPKAETQSFDGSIHNFYGLNNAQVEDLNTNISGIVSDADSLMGQSLGGGLAGSATTTERTVPAPLTDLIFGIAASAAGLALGYLAGGVAGAVVGGIGLGLIGYFWKYFSFLAFGFFTWIDLFINPAWGTGFVFLNLALKGVFFLVMLVGLAGFVLPFFSSWRK